jgi:hypothetical protein
MRSTMTLLHAHQRSEISDFAYWDQVRSRVEEYRSLTRVAFSGEVVEWHTSQDLIPFYAQVVKERKLPWHCHGSNDGSGKSVVNYNDCAGKSVVVIVGIDCHGLPLSL